MVGKGSHGPHEDGKQEQHPPATAVLETYTRGNDKVRRALLACLYGAYNRHVRHLHDELIRVDLSYPSPNRLNVWERRFTKSQFGAYLDDSDTVGAQNQRAMIARILPYISESAPLTSLIEESRN